MSTWALIPIKPRAQCKTRLASILTAAQREALARELLAHVLATVRATRGIDRIALISRERDDVADDVLLLEDRGSDLNTSLESGVDQALAAGASTVLVLPADLPHLRSDDVDRLLAGARTAGIAIAPDRHEHGTNALCFTAQARIRFQFGPGSFGTITTALDPRVVQLAAKFWF